MKGNTRQAIGDGYLYLILENVTKYILPYADALAMLVMLGILVWILMYLRNNKIFVLSQNPIIETGEHLNIVDLECDKYYLYSFR